MLKLNMSDRFELPVIETPAAVSPAKPQAKRVRKPKAAAPTVSTVDTVADHLRDVTKMVTPFKLRLTVALGVAIPLLSLATSKVAGTLAGGGHIGLAAFGAAIGVAVLAVSLSHLAWAIRDVTGSGPRASWALAVALDCSLVLCELVHVGAAGAGLDAVCWVLLVTVAGFSMVLNCHAFLNHKS